MASKTRQSKAALALAAGSTQAVAAALANVSERTVSRWTKQPDFVALLRSVTDDHLAQASRRLSSGTLEALAVVSSVLSDRSLAPATRLQAARLWLEHAWRARELQDLTERIHSLEEIIHEHRKTT